MDKEEFIEICSTASIRRMMVEVPMGRDKVFVPSEPIGAGVWTTLAESHLPSLVRAQRQL